MQQVNAFCDSVQAGLTAPTLRVYARYAARVFYNLQLYVCAGKLTKASFLDAFNELPQIENAGAILRAAFREAEHALITLPRTTISKKETVADATHSS
jgi:hypothetical protein